MGRKPKSTADNDNMMTLFDDEEFTETENTVEKDSQEEDTSTNEAEVTREEEVTDNNDELTENGTEEPLRTMQRIPQRVTTVMTARGMVILKNPPQQTCHKPSP